jgi:hypothetical protein
MENEKELVKLINVLRRTSRMALQSEWTGGKDDAAAFCTEQYNRVFARLKEMDPGVGMIFEPLPVGSSLTVVAMASRQLAAYYEDELGPVKGFERGRVRVHPYAVDPNKFREFWDWSSREFEDIGEFIRENIDEWLRHRKEATKESKDTKCT